MNALKVGDVLINLDWVHEIYVGTAVGKYTLVARFTNGNVEILNEYETREEAEADLERICSRFGAYAL